MRRLSNQFSFDGRLGRVGWRRLHLRIILLGCLAILATLFILISDLPRVFALFPLALLPILLVAFISAWTRRLHDVGVHARGEILRIAGIGVIGFAPPLAFLLVPDLPDWAYAALGAWFVGGLIFSMLIGWQRPEWRLGDDGPNEFGPASD